MKSNILLCVIYIYQLIGVSSLRSLSEEDFIDRVLFRTQQNIYRRLPKGWSIFLGTSLQADNGTLIPLGTDNFATGIGVHYKLKRNGDCNTKVESHKNTLQCPIMLDQFQVTLPRFHGDGGKQYILRVAVEVKIVLWNPTVRSYLHLYSHDGTHESRKHIPGKKDFADLTMQGISSLSYKRYINKGTTYKMTDSNNVIVTEPPARYSISPKLTLNLRGIMQSRLQAFLTDGEFHDSLSTALKGVPKPADFHR
uniref:Putative secreted protein n=1 Tax=Ixodes ricinus TaxID=34613 RepID=A0A6B0V4U3_IXORI